MISVIFDTMNHRVICTSQHLVFLQDVLRTENQLRFSSSARAGTMTDGKVYSALKKWYSLALAINTSLLPFHFRGHKQKMLHY